MRDAYQLRDPQGAQDFVKSFAPAVRRKGEALARAGRVKELQVEEAGMAFQATVNDREDWQVNLYYLEDDDDDAGGWSGDCSCAEEFDCEHIFAVMRELLAEHSTAVVRNLSSGGPGLEARDNSQPAGRRPAEQQGELMERLKNRLGRALSRDESGFIKKVQGVFARCRQTRQITHWDFEEMGLRLGGVGWSGLQIWPALPGDEYEFWLYVAHAAGERSVAIPKFMETITDLGPIKERLWRWQRSREIERWKQTLASLDPDSGYKPRANQGPIDLRLVITEKEARLESLPSGETEFQHLKSSRWHQFRAEVESGAITLTPEAEWLWQPFAQRINYGLDLRWQFLDPESSRTLGRFFRLHLLEGRLVAVTGQPLTRPAEPLRWNLIEASSSEDDYRLRLVQADGSPAPTVLAIFPGTPTLYLTTEAVFAGPVRPSGVLDPAGETRIPAPAIEEVTGVGFLKSIGVEMPSRLRERVRMVPYKVAIRCELRQAFGALANEDCVVSATAEAENGRSLAWDGYNWLESTPKILRAKLRDKEIITLYDSASLSEAQSVLNELGLKPGGIGQGAFLRVTRKFPELFSNWLKLVPPQITVQLMGDLASFANATVAGRVKLDVTEAEIDWFDLRVVLDVSETTLTPDEIKSLLNAKGNYVRLPGKGWRRLQFDLSEEENERLARLGLNARELSAEPQRLHALQLADEAAKRFLPEQQVERVHRRVAEIKSRVTPDLPEGVTAELRPYQLEGFHFLAYLTENRFGGILADDMGLGKTLQTLTWLTWMRVQLLSKTEASLDPSVETTSTSGSTPRSSNIEPSLVVCPKSVMDNWRAEAARFTPGTRVRVWSASDLGSFPQELAKADLHILNYSQLRTLGESLTTVQWLIVILDEGQYIKNPNSQTAQVARALRARHRLVLTGTPIENRLLDLWSLMAFAMPGVLGSRAHFAKLYDSKGDPFARRRLASRIRPFLLRRTKSQVAKDLPDRIEEDLFCEIEGEQLAMYRAELKRAQQLLLKIQTQKDLAQQQFHFLVSLLRLRQICCDPRLRNPESTAASAKTEALLEQLEPLMEEKQKVLVFSQFVELLDLLRPALVERNWPVFYLTGSTENRGELVHEFQSTDGPAVFLISLKAGGFGLNLTAASYVVLFDPWWNPAVENQAIDRTHRIGQTSKVIAYRLLIKNSIEEKIRALQKTKKSLADDVLGEEKFSQQLTIDDLRFLLSE